MDRVNAVICHPLYLEYYHRLERAEKERIFCRHQMSHLLDVARIAYIRNLEKGYGFRKDVIYAAAVLHRRLRDGADTLEKLLYEADKASRLCLSCPANRECNWSEEKKNMEIKI